MPEQPQEQPVVSKKLVSKRRPSKRLIISGAGILVATAAVIAVGWYLVWINSPAYVLAQSFKNTLALDKTTYQLTYDDSGTNTAGLNSVKIDGQYDKNKGSRATGDLVFKNNDYGLAINTDLALDTSGNAFYQYKKVSNVAQSGSKNQMSNELLQQVLASFGSHWSRLDSNMLQSGSSCVITALQKMQGDTDMGEKFVGTLLGSGALTINKATAQGDTTVYTLKGKADKAAALADAYTKTNVYTDLVKCNESTYKVTADSIKSTLEQSTAEVTINNKRQTIDKFVFTRKQDSGTSKLQFTVTPADKVEVTIPTGVATS